ncbi:MAG: hypothetical protein LHW49_01765 [Candidatus Cloacimonetes bacterium]|nr:hypothetical protein [Candidatus Cloacimonadota bacterium]
MKSENIILSTLKPSLEVKIVSLCSLNENNALQLFVFLLFWHLSAVFNN